jgi:hypothetical protein
MVMSTLLVVAVDQLPDLLASFSACCSWMATLALSAYLVRFLRGGYISTSTSVVRMPMAIVALLAYSSQCRVPLL